MMKNTKQLTNGLKLMAITSLLILTGRSHGQVSQQHILTNMWYLDSYKIGSKEYPPKKREREDFILFEEDMTFVSKSEGKQEEGTYILNTNGAYIEMTDENGEALKAYIISITKEKLILKFDHKEIRDIEVHYKTHR